MGARSRPAAKAVDEETNPPAPASKRPTRADAARNYDKLVAAAQDLFATEGTDVALDKVAAEAGVGVGTLYRHFPNRTALLEATFRSYSAQIVADGRRLLDTESAVAALESMFAAYMATAGTKRGMREAIMVAVGNDAPVFEETRNNSRDLMTAILESGRRSGDFREDVEPADITRLMGGLSMTCVAEDTEETRRRLIGVVLDGLRPPRS
ncbi:TetR family transcriptional regulator [Gordonia sp. SID5947]|uniref:SbtR family transcriptional regulator n=1 Tax=Gordonia sp. SID5947 TaxID=2690315 RepID=UPI00136F304B|nr:TetR family transcriptional regulator [Gordonia sp. SID5947]